MTDPGHSFLYKTLPKSEGKDAAAPASRTISGAVRSSGSHSPLSQRSRQSMQSSPAGSPTRMQREGDFNSEGLAGTPARAGSRPEAADQPPASGQLGRWKTALGNLEDARVAIDTLSHMVDDAIYLDSDAYNQIQPKVAYLRTIQAQQARIATLESENRGLQKQVAHLEQTRRQSEAQVRDVQSELDNNSAVFKLHYSEILAKNEEIARLKAVIEGLGGSAS